MRTPLARLLTTTALATPLALFSIAPLAHAAAEIGKVAAVNPSMDGTPPSSARRTLSLGADIIENERVETSEDGSGQLLFKDQTTLTVAPRSDIVLDRYIYDPTAQSGEITLTMTKGVLRFIGGRITKANDAVVNTPTATIGIRGGLALIVVDANGQTRVCHIAGEYSHVKSTGGGGEVYLSRPNACATVTSAGATFQGLIDSQELAEFYKQLEGDGSGGSAASASQVASERVAEVNSGQTGGENADPISTSGESAPRDQSARDPLQTPQDEGRPPIGVVLPGPPPPDQEGPIVTDLTGGAALPGAVQPFNEVQLGSLIGVASEGEIVIPVPNTGSSETAFDTATILAGLGNPTITALDSAELFRFDGFDGATSSLLTGSGDTFGPIEGVGLFDASQEFLFVEFVPFDQEEPFDRQPANGGFAVMGNPTPNQGQFFADDATIVLNNQTRPPGDDLTGLDGNQSGNEVIPGIPGIDDEFPGGPVLVRPPRPLLAVINPDLATDPELPLGLANTVEGFRYEPNIFFETEQLRGQTPLFMIGNRGMARYDNGIVEVPGGLTGGGKWLSGALYIGDSEAGQISHLFVLADDIESQFRNSAFNETSGPQLATTVIGTESFDERLDGGPVGVSLILAEQGTFEDAFGNTLFSIDADAAAGIAGQHLVISSASREEPGEGIQSPAFETFPGVGIDLVSTPSITGDTATEFVTEEFDLDPTVNLLTRDEDLTETINNPLPLAGNRLVNGYDVAANVLSAGFASGIGRCESGLCGPSAGGAFNSGLYALQGDAQFFFDSQLPFSEEIDNEVDASFQMFSFDAGAVSGSSEGVTSVSLSGGGQHSAMIDDNRFGVADDSAFVNVNSQQFGSGQLVVASSGLVGDGGIFPKGVDTEPEFVRWGWWSAAYTLEHDAGVDNPDLRNRQDIVHLGNWVAGVDFDSGQDEIPLNVTGQWDGLAVGTMADLNAGTTKVVGGSFSLTYQFQGSVSGGSLALSIPDAGINERINVLGNGVNGLAYTGTAVDFNGGDAPSSITDVRGQFFSNGLPVIPETGQVGDPTVATGGVFDHQNFANQTQTVGVFAGDRTGALGPIVQP